MHSQLTNLQQTFENNRNPDNAIHMEKYMRDQFPFIGLKSQERRNYHSIVRLRLLKCQCEFERNKI